MVVSFRSARTGQSLIPKLFWSGALDCKTALGRSFFFRRTETGPGMDHAGAFGKDREPCHGGHNNGPDDYTSGPFKIIRHGYIRRAC